MVGLIPRQGARRGSDASARPLIRFSPAVDKHVIGSGIPRVMNADEEQQQCRRANAKHGLVRMGKSRVIAETGAGMHGVATATAAALFGLTCRVYMGSEDVRRQ